MSENHHTPIPTTRVAANATNINNPLGQLDTAITTNATNIATNAADIVTVNTLPVQYKDGMKIRRVSNTLLAVDIGSVKVNGTLVNKTTQTNLDLATAANWIGGSSLESASEFVHVYVDSSGNIKLYDEAPQLPTPVVAIASMDVNQAGWVGTSGLGLNATSVVYDGDAGEGSVVAGNYVLIYDDSTTDPNKALGRGKGSAASASKNFISAALITAIDTGTNTLTLEAGHQIAIFDNDQLVVIPSGDLIYRQVSSTWYRWIGAWWNDSGSNLEDLTQQHGGKRKYSSNRYILNEGSNYTTTSTTFVDIDATNLSLDVNINSDEIMIGFAGSIRNSNASVKSHLDIKLDGVSIVGDDGMLISQLTNANDIIPFTINWTQTGLVPGTHTFTLQWKVSAGTATMWAGAGTAEADIHPQFWVREVQT
jgi:hypothetical protein